MKGRADQLLFDLGLAQSRSKAKDLIQSGKVRFRGDVVTKASQLVEEEGLEIESHCAYVSRGAYKLQTADLEFGLSFEGKVIADVGASTGGFTDYVLRKSALKVFAIDVGHGQLDPKLASDDRVENLEKTNFRELDPTLGPVDMIVSDLSFISLRLVIDKMIEILKPQGELVVLFKPQFEVGKEHIQKNGIVKDEKVIETSLQNFLNFCQEKNLEVVGSVPSEIAGRGGNQEYLIYLKRKD